MFFFFFFFFNDTATTEIYTLSLHDALPISADVTSGGIDVHEDVADQQSSLVAHHRRSADDADVGELAERNEGLPAMGKDGFAPQRLHRVLHRALPAQPRVPAGSPGPRTVMRMFRDRGIDHEAHAGGVLLHPRARHSRPVDGNQHASQVVEIAAQLLRIAHVDGESVPSLDGRADGRAADGRLDGALDVADREAVSRERIAHWHDVDVQAA